jgi:hypothetical protein
VVSVREEFNMRSFAPALGIVAFALVAGCTDPGPKRYRVSGEAKFNGAPIVFGDVVFTPDGSKQNSGPQGIAQIRDGKFDTVGLDGKGIGGGPMVVKVTVHSGPLDKGGKFICEYEYTVDLPRGDTTHNIEVPASAAKKGPGSDI